MNHSQSSLVSITIFIKWRYSKYRVQLALAYFNLLIYICYYIFAISKMPWCLIVQTRSYDFLWPFQNQNQNQILRLDLDFQYTKISPGKLLHRQKFLNCSATSALVSYKKSLWSFCITNYDKIWHNIFKMYEAPKLGHYLFTIFFAVFKLRFFHGPRWHVKLWKSP